MPFEAMILMIDILEMNVTTKYVSNKTNLGEVEFVVELKKRTINFVFMRRSQFILEGNLSSLSYN